jgi:hypothetical protein
LKLKLINLFNRYVASHDICITDELKSNGTYETVWKNISKNEKLRDLILGRTTILQVAFVLCFILAVNIENANYKNKIFFPKSKIGGSS